MTLHCSLNLTISTECCEPRAGRGWRILTCRTPFLVESAKSILGVHSMWIFGFFLLNTAYLFSPPNLCSRSSSFIVEYSEWEICEGRMFSPDEVSKATFCLPASHCGWPVHGRLGPECPHFSFSFLILMVL